MVGFVTMEVLVFCGIHLMNICISRLPPFACGILLGALSPILGIDLETSSREVCCKCLDWFVW